MAATPTAMFRDVLTTTTTTTLNTVTTGKTWVVTNIVVTNANSSPVTVTIALDGKALLATRTVAANDALAFDLKQVLGSTKAITGGASTGTGVTCHISGVEV
jgi:hypothetical protein